jgi:hypothetical protein
VASAARIGRASAAFFGTSSPNSIESRVATARAITGIQPAVASPANGRSTGASSRSRAGSAR